MDEVIQSYNKTCRTCLSVKKQHESYRELDYNLEIYGGTVKNILQACVPEMDLRLCEENLICDLCFTLLKTAYEFKIKCLSAEEKIFDYITHKGLPITNAKININDVITNEKGKCGQDTTFVNIKEEYYFSSDGDEIKLISSRSQSPEIIEVMQSEMPVRNVETSNKNDLINLDVVQEVVVEDFSKLAGPDLPDNALVASENQQNTDIRNHFQTIDLISSSESDSDDEFEDVENQTTAFVIDKCMNMGNRASFNIDTSKNNTIDNNLPARSPKSIGNHAFVDYTAADKSSKQNTKDNGVITLTDIIRQNNDNARLKNGDVKPKTSFCSPVESTPTNKRPLRLDGVHNFAQKNKISRSNDGTFNRLHRRDNTVDGIQMLIGDEFVESNRRSYFNDESSNSNRIAFLNTMRQLITRSDSPDFPTTPCQTCANGFASQYELENHIAQHFEKRSELALLNRLGTIFVCPVCGKEYYRKRHFVKHFYKHNKGKPLYRCKECSFVASQKTAMKTHRLIEHYSQQQHICPRCKKSFPNEYFLLYHLKNHEKDDLKRSRSDSESSSATPYLPASSVKTFLCQNCKKNFLNEYELMIHKLQQKCKAKKPTSFRTKSRTANNGAVLKMKIFKCGFCSFSTTVAEQLQEHVKDHERNVTKTWQNCFGM